MMPRVRRTPGRPRDREAPRRRHTVPPPTACFPVVIESQAIMVSTRVAIGKLIHALEVWSDDPRLPNIEPLQHEPSTADSTAIQRCIGQYSALALCTRGVVLYCNTALYILQLYSALHSTALYNPPQIFSRKPKSGQLGPMR